MQMSTASWYDGHWSHWTYWSSLQVLARCQSSHFGGSHVMKTYKVLKIFKNRYFFGPYMGMEGCIPNRRHFGSTTICATYCGKQRFLQTKYNGIWYVCKGPRPIIIMDNKPID